MSADSLEIRIVKLESDVKRIEAISEPRFERIEKTLTLLLSDSTSTKEQVNEIKIKLEGIAAGIRLIGTTAVSKEELTAVRLDVARIQAEVLKEVNAMTIRFIGWLAIIAGFGVAALKYLP